MSPHFLFCPQHLQTPPLPPLEFCLFCFVFTTLSREPYGRPREGVIPQPAKVPVIPVLSRS